MKKLKFSIALALGLGLMACGAPTEAEQIQKINELRDNLAEDHSDEQNNNECESIKIESFKNFLELDASVKENDLVSILGKFSGGNYSDDKSVFIYNYNNTKNIPLSVFFNAESKTIETVRIEMLCFADKFEQEKKKLAEDFTIDFCQLNLFGKKPKQITELFGAGDRDKVDDSSIEKDVRTLIYYTEDNKTSVTFKFYLSQENKLSSIEVNYNF